MARISSFTQQLIIILRTECFLFNIWLPLTHIFKNSFTCVSSVLHSSPDQHIQSSDRFWALGPCGSLWRIICFITRILGKCFSQEEAGPSCEENSSPKSPASPLPAAALQTQGLLARHRRNVWPGTEVEVTETQWPGFAFSSDNCSVVEATQHQKRKKNDRKSWPTFVQNHQTSSATGSHSCDGF